MYVLSRNVRQCDVLFQQTPSTLGSSLPETVRCSGSHGHLTWHLCVLELGPAFPLGPWNPHHSRDRADPGNLYHSRERADTGNLYRPRERAAVGCWFGAV